MAKTSVSKTASTDNPATAGKARSAAKKAAAPVTEARAKAPAAAASKPDMLPAKPAKSSVQKAEPSKSKTEPKVEPETRARKAKLVRDSFTMPETEYEALGEIKKACLKAGIEVKKSELLRVGVALLKRLDTAGIRDVLSTLPSLKAGRPKKGK